MQEYVAGWVLEKKICVLERSRTRPRAEKAGTRALWQSDTVACISVVGDFLLVGSVRKVGSVSKLVQT